MAYIELDIVERAGIEKVAAKFDLKCKLKEWVGPNGLQVWRFRGSKQNVSKFCKDEYGDNLDEFIKGK